MNQLLQYVAEGEQDKAEALIQKDKNLLLHAGTVTDLSGREFKQITAFQYALWAMDYHMWTMIQKYLPQEDQKEQLKELETKGTAYGKHFSLQGLTGALQTYVDYIDYAKKVWDYDRQVHVVHNWCKVVGGEQKLLPAHVVNEYCRPDRAFKPCPPEWKSKLPRIREVSKYDKGSWFTPFSSKDGLGFTYAFYRYDCEQAQADGVRYTGGGAVWGEMPRADLKALQSLWKTRTQQLEVLKSQLLSAARPTQLALQDQLIAACEQGDAKTVTLLLEQGAKPDVAGTPGRFSHGKQPLGAAVWGMCPDVVNALLKEAKGIAPMTWQECEQHNKKYYNNEVFIIPKFNPQTHGWWYQLLLKMDPNLFIRAYHLKKADEQWHVEYTASWDLLKEHVSLIQSGACGNREWQALVFPKDTSALTEKGFVSFRSQIKQSIETAKQPIKLAQEDLKYESPIQPPKSTPPLPSISQAIPQTLIPPPKPQATPEQLKLQDELIAACEQGDAKTVTRLLAQGAKPDVAGTPGRFSLGKQPLGAAVWGMCPDVVNALLKEAKGIAPMTWQECEQHNKKYYNNEVFIIPKFDPKTYIEWSTLLKKMDLNSFIRAYHLKSANDFWLNSNSSSWESLKKFVSEYARNPFYPISTLDMSRDRNAIIRTEIQFVSYRSQIKQGIESAKQPTVALHF